MTGHRSEPRRQNTYSGHKWSPKRPKYSWELFWFCNSCDKNCGDGPHSPFIEHCPRCQHLRCPNCNFEEHKIHGGECSTTFADFLSIQALMRQASHGRISQKLPPVPNVAGPAASPLTGPFRPSSHSENHEPETRNPGEDSRMKFTPCSTNSSTSPSEMFSDTEDSTNTEPDLDNEDTQSEEESWDVEPTFELGYVNPMHILESHLMYLLRDHLDLAAHLIPEIHWRVHFEPPEDVEGHNPAQSHEQRTNQSTQEHAAISSNASTNAKTSSGPLKRGRGPEENEEDDCDGPKRPRPNPGPVSRHFASGSSGQRPTFACHFHKFDPRKYGPLTDRCFRTCAGPGPFELRRIKDHLRDTHKCIRCVGCYTKFNSIDELCTHQSSEICAVESQALKEGINEEQWASIKDLLKAKRGLRALEKMQHDIDKWFGIWDLLFPNVSPPSNPWNEIQPQSSMAPPLDVDCLLSTFEYLIQLDVQQGMLQYDDVIHRRYLHALNEAIGITALTSGDRGSSVGNMLEPRDSTISPEQTYVPASMPYPDSVGNIGEQINSEWIDPSLIAVPSVTFGQNDFSNILALSPRGQAFHSPQPVSHATESQSMVSGNAASPPTNSLEEAHNDLDSFFDFSIDTHITDPSLPDLHGDNHIENSEILAEVDQNFFGLDEYMDNRSLAALLEAENELPAATAPWKTKHDGSKILNTMETNFNYDE